MPFHLTTQGLSCSFNVCALVAGVQDNSLDIAVDEHLTVDMRLDIPIQRIQVTRACQSDQFVDLAEPADRCGFEDGIWKAERAAIHDLLAQAKMRRSEPDGAAIGITIEVQSPVHRTSAVGGTVVTPAEETVLPTPAVPALVSRQATIGCSRLELAAVAPITGERLDDQPVTERPVWVKLQRDLHIDDAAIPAVIECPRTACRPATARKSARVVGQGEIVLVDAQGGSRSSGRVRGSRVG